MTPKTINEVWIVEYKKINLKRMGWHPFLVYPDKKDATWDAKELDRKFPEYEHRIRRFVSAK